MQTIVGGPRRRALLPALCPVLALALVLAVCGEQASAQSRGATSSTLAPGAGFDGLHRAAVARLQQRILRLGYAPGPIDGLYGPLTTGAVRRLQAANRVAVDGIAGPVTRRVLHGQADARPAVVRRAQRRLRALGHHPGPVDGIYGPRTVAAVHRFQDAADLSTGARLTASLMARLDEATHRAKAPQDVATKPTAPQAAPEPPAATTEPPAATTEPVPATPSPSEELPPLPTPAPPVAPAGSVTTTPDPTASPEADRPAAAPAAQPAPDGGQSFPTPLALLIGVTAIAVAFLIGRDSGPPPPRPATFRSGRKSAFAGALSVAAVGVPALVVLVGRGCGAQCADDGATVLRIIYVLTGIATLAVTVALLVRYLAARRRSRKASAARRRSRNPLFVIVIPARDEELAIGDTVRRILDLPYHPLMAVVVNDGSNDGTTHMATTAAAGDPRLVVVNTCAHHNGHGKEAALDHAYHVISVAERAGLHGLGGAEAKDVVIGVLEPGAWLAPDALSIAADRFTDHEVAAVELPVRIANAREGVVARMQDIEAVLKSELAAGEGIPDGSVDLAGNGQFVRLAAVRRVEEAPWAKARSLGRELGVLLADRGGRVLSCRGTCVAEPAVDSPRELVRQRVACVRKARRWAPVVLLAGIHAVLAAGDVLGVLHIHDALIALLTGDDVAYRLAVVALACAPLVLVALVYVRATVHDGDTAPPRPRLWTVPGLSLLFAAYVLILSAAALARAVARRRETRSEDEVVAPAEPRPAAVAASETETKTEKEGPTESRTAKEATTKKEVAHR
jgi:1,2-diacylglycerol 3-beta-glucosyltransferase